MNKEIERAQKKIAKHYLKIKTIQDVCLHPNETLETVNHSDAGGYDSSCVKYWKSYKCGECDKKWSTE